MILIQIALLAVGFLMLVKGADWFVDGSAGIAKKLGIPQLVIGLTIVALGTSLPELVTSVVAAIIAPVIYDAAFLIDGIIAVLAGVLLWVSVLKTRSLRKPWGIVMLLCYLAYLVYLLV